MYYYSTNYGGMLQAYALCKLLKKLGYEAEQISYVPNINYSGIKGSQKKKCSIIKKLCFKAKKVTNDLAFEKRKQRFHQFRDSIPHSPIIYNDSTIKNCAGIYDIYITGSDQVWNPDCYRPAFSLSFLGSESIKVSYAASIGCIELCSTDKAKYEMDLADYKCISVREQEAVAQISPLVRKTVYKTLDPTLMISAVEWDKIKTKKQMSFPYLFCYFIGDNRIGRSIAYEYAKKKGLTIVMIPYVNGLINRYDRIPGAKRIMSASPEDFISLVSNAEMVFTDSFHATVFSCIYEKRFVVFKRTKTDKMVARINSLLSLFDMKNAFCDDENKTNIEYVEKILEGEYKINKSLYEKEKKNSLAFIKMGCE